MSGIARTVTGLDMPALTVAAGVFLIAFVAAWWLLERMFGDGR